MLTAKYLFQTIEEVIIREIKKTQIPEVEEKKVKVKYPLFVKKNAANIFEKAGESDFQIQNEKKTRFTKVEKREKQAREKDAVERRMQFSMREKDSKLFFNIFS